MAALAWLSLWATGLPIERFLAARVPAPLLGLAAGSAIGAVVRWTPSPIDIGIRHRAWSVAILTVPLAVVAGLAMLRLANGLPLEHAAQAESVAALVAGVGAALTGWRLGGFKRPRSRWLFAMAVGVAAGGAVSLYA